MDFEGIIMSLSGSEEKDKYQRDLYTFELQRNKANKQRQCKNKPLNSENRTEVTGERLMGAKGTKGPKNCGQW